jgi:hypothetical protein
MKRLTYLLAVAALFLTLGSSTRAQISLRPTPPPAVTAENEPWYLSGEPISFGGNLYYPAGAVTHFSRNEMVRTGTYGNTPIYVRTTQEPGSIIYVPLSGGVVRPYERRRSGDLAGTVGSSAPSFRVTLPAEEPPQSTVASAPAPPTGVPVGTTGYVPAPAPEPAPVPAPVGTTGTVQLMQAAPARTSIQTVQRPVGLNTVFVQFEGGRYFSAGPAVEYSATRFTQIGEHQGFPVYQENGKPGVIYLSLLQGTPGLIAPYKAR